MASALDVKPFKSVDLNPGATLQQFNKYIEELEPLFELVFRKADGTPYTPSDREKKQCCASKEAMTCAISFNMLGK